MLQSAEATHDAEYRQDLIRWEPPWYVVCTDDSLDGGITQFYAIQEFIVCRPLMIGMVKVLRDDLVAEGTQENSYGLGWTTLAWMRDGNMDPVSNEPMSSCSRLHRSTMRYRSFSRVVSQRVFARRNSKNSGPGMNSDTCKVCQYLHRRGVNYIFEQYV